VNIHPTAVIDPKAELGPDVTVGPFTVIGPDVVIGARTVLGPHVHITGRTTIGEDCRIHTGVALGEPPQDFKYRDEISYVRLGDRNTLREFVTIHLAVGDGNVTSVGNDNLLMAYCHIGHNCVLGNNICMANYVGISGCCQVDDRVVFGGMAGIHQNVHIGRMAMVGGSSKVTSDVPPFIMVDGRPARPFGLNTVGLKRAGFSPELRTALKQAYRLLLHQNHNMSEALEAAREELPAYQEVEEFVQFVAHSRLSGRHLEGRHA
jgi:UDP-N-acetylglucosamine acyltransferase